VKKDFSSTESLWIKQDKRGRQETFNTGILYMDREGKMPLYMGVEN
jgi:hypothetical protein